jgi:hypothetical protein
VTSDRPQLTTERSAADGQPMAQRCVRDPVPMSPLGRSPSRPGAIDPQNTCASDGSRSKGFGGRRRAPRSCSVNPHMTAFAPRLDATESSSIRAPSATARRTKRSPIASTPGWSRRSSGSGMRPRTCGAAFGPARQAGGGTQTTPCSLAQRASV